MLRPNQTSDNAPEDGAPKSESPKSVVQQSLAMLTRSTLALLGALLIPIGIIVAFLTPILPVGLPIVILGVVLMARNASWGRRFIQNTLARYPRLARFAPDWLLRLIFGEQR